MSANWLDELRGRARELLPKLPYQQIRDSPSVKYYTQWEYFERCIDPNPSVINGVSPRVDWYEANITSINAQLRIARLPEGVKAVDLSDLGEDYGKLLFRSIDINESKALARHVANLLGGAYIEVTKDLKEPVRVLIGTSQVPQTLIPTHYTVVVNDGVKASLGLYIVNDGGCSSTTAEIYLGKNSLLNLLVVSIGDESPGFTNIKLITNDGSNVVARSLLIGGSMNHHREDYLLQGKSSRLNHLSLEVGLGNSRIDYQVNAMHFGESSSSFSRVLGVAKDKAFVIHRALGRIFESGKWSDTNVEGKVFVLNEGAYAASVPIIMVDTGDVNGARHSAADASLDEDMINYLRLRGFSKSEVLDLILHEIVSQFLESLPEVFTGDGEYLKGIINERLFLKSS
ncbi:MAG: SufD family Fe-S cluster assembly protein [Vulcanisaeta sp. AZ3]|jgi:Fe-S cluster assembly scaffold protein SufB